MLVIFRRWSHVGRRPVPIDSRAAVELLPQTSSSQTPFGQTPVVQRVKVSGPFGCLEFPIHQGLTVSLSPGPVSGEQLLKVDIDAKAYDKMSKYCRKFVNSMWGTTNSVLRQHIEGVTEVRRTWLS
jgi:ribosomal protein L6P/L9E